MHNPHFSSNLEESIRIFADGKISYISSIFNVFSEKNEKAKLKASKFLLKLIEEKSFAAFIKIAEHMHGSFYMHYDNSIWLTIRKDDLFTKEMTVNEKRAVLIFASFHTNGFLREHAIKELVSYPGTLQYILIRRNDWVKEVRNTAKNLLIKKYNNLVEHELINAIPVILKLTKCERENFKEDYETFILRLLGNEFDLSNGLASNNPKIRLFCAELLLKKNGNTEKLNDYLINEKCPYIREKIFKLYLNSDINEKILKLMLIDNNAKIRMMALNYIYSNELKSYDFLFTYLLDCNVDIRSYARFIIKQNENNFSFRNYYINVLEKNYIAIAGLGETGNKEDSHIIEKYLLDESIKTVRTTIYALLKLDKEKYIDGFVSLLNDERNGIVKDIIKFIDKEVQLYEDKIKAIFVNSKNNFIKLNCAKLLFKATKWNALNHMVLLMNDENPEISELAKIATELWIEKFNKAFIPLSNKQREFILDNISKIKRKDISIKKLLYYLN